MDAILLLAALSEIERTLVELSAQPRRRGPHGLWVDLVTSRDRKASCCLPRRRFRGSCAAHPSIQDASVTALGRRRAPEAPALVADVVHRGLDRVVRLDFKPVAGAGPRLILEAFGSQPNLLLTDAEGIILEAARHTPAAAARSCLPGASYIPPQPSRLPDPRLLGTSTPWPPRWSHCSPRALTRARPAPRPRGHQRLWAREVAARSGRASAAALHRRWQTFSKASPFGLPSHISSWTRRMRRPQSCPSASSTFPMRCSSPSKP